MIIARVVDFVSYLIFPFLFLGDFNLPIKGGVGESLVLKSIKEYHFGLRSVVTEDMLVPSITGGEVYTVVRIKKDLSSSKHGHRSAEKKEPETVQSQGAGAGFQSSLIDEIEAAIGGSSISPTKIKVADDASESETEHRQCRELLQKGITDFIFYTPLRPDQPGLRTLAVLDMPDFAAMGKRRLPNEFYPSNHISIGADFQYLW